MSSLLSPFYRPNQALQALNTIPTSDDVFRQCLRKLRAICGHHTTLPTSHIIRGDLAKTGEIAIAFGGFADVWQGAHDGRRVCIKVLRVSLNNSESLTKVRVPLRHIFFLLTEDRPVGAVVVLQRGRRVETIKTPKRRPFPWRYEQAFTVCVGVDAKWDFNPLRQEKPGSGSDHLGEPFNSKRLDLSITDTVRSY